MKTLCSFIALLTLLSMQPKPTINYYNNKGQRILKQQGNVIYNNKGQVLARTNKDNQTQTKPKKKTK
jgi:hypothetical protein